MGYVLNRTTKDFRASVNSPDFDPAVWLVMTKAQPNVAAVEALLAAAVPRKYWKFPGDSLGEMTAPEKAVVDAADLPALKAALIAALPSQAESYILTRYKQATLDQLASIYNAAVKMPNRQAYLEKFFAWRETIYVEQQKTADQITAAADTAAALAVVFDTAQFDLTDPMATVEEALKIPD